MKVFAVGGSGKVGQEVLRLLAPSDLVTEIAVAGRNLAHAEQVAAIGSKASAVQADAGLVHPTGTVMWNGEPVADPETFLRPGRVAYVAQILRVLSGTFHDNVRLDHDRNATWSIDHARLGHDIEHAGGPGVAVGHRGVRLSGGQVQRLALARALATDSELLIADDVSSALDATTELDLWDSMTASGRTVIGATTKRSALARADRVVVVVDGTVAAQGPWSDLKHEWNHLAG